MGLEQEWLRVLAIVVATIAVALVVLVVTAVRSDRKSAAGKHARQRPSRDSFRPVEEPPPPKKRAAVIVNPTKFDSMDEVRARLAAAMVLQDWESPLVLETTADDPGLGQTRAALAEQVDLVCAMGGDGTVRAVAQVLAGTKTPMGLLPAGTGNLLARNLLVPMDTLDAAVGVATGGRNRHIDVGWITLDPPAEPGADAESDDTDSGSAPSAPDRHHIDAQLTDPGENQTGSAAADMLPTPTPTAGDATGEDGPADTVDGHATEEAPSAPTPSDGPDSGTHEPAGDADAAYPSTEPDAPATGERHAFIVMAGMGFDAQVMEDTTAKLKDTVGVAAYFAQGMKHMFRPRFTTTITLDDRKPITCKARTVLAGNCGRLTGGIQLMPDAVVDDGELNVVAITAKGIYGLAGAATHILARKPESHAQLDRWTARRLEVRVEEPQKVEIDGDLLGTASHAVIEVVPRSLIVRVSTAVPATPTPLD
ncbi:MAG TPA: diacylglycerol kinase family protein [Phycicoccus sp.]|nr:diacylglycerol kinase family protein [Phycicoccus sp.]